MASLKDKSYIFVTFIVTTEFVLVSHGGYLSMKKCFMMTNLSSDGISSRWMGAGLNICSGIPHENVMNL